MLITIREISFIDFEITHDELDIFTRCFKSYIGFKRNQYRKILAMIHRDKITDNQKYTHLLELLKNKLSNEILDLCNVVIEICKNFMAYLINSNVKLL